MGFGKEANAATYYISTSGDDINCTGLSNAAYPGSGTGQVCAWRTHVHAETTASNGDTIHTAPGVYVENKNTTAALQISKGITWIADGSPAYGTHIIKGNANIYNIELMNSNGAMSMTGYTFSPAAGQLYNVVFDGNATNKSLTGCWLDSASTSLLYANGNAGSTTNSVNNSVINATSNLTEITLLGNFSLTNNNINGVGASNIIHLGSANADYVQNITGNTIVAGNNAHYVFNLVAGNGAMNILNNSITVTGLTEGLLLATGATGAISFNSNTVVSSADETNISASIYITTGIYNVTVQDNNLSFTNLATPGSIVFIKDQLNPLVQRNTITTDSTGTLTHITMYSSGTNMGVAQVLNNILSTHSLSGYVIRLGTDSDGGSGNNKLDGSIIRGNTIYGPLFYNSSLDQNTVPIHGILFGYSINGIVEKNLVYGAGYGVVYKGNSTNTSGGVFNNQIINCRWGIHPKGINALKIYDNIIYSSIPMLAQPILIGAVTYITLNVELKNNIIDIASGLTSVNNAIVLVDSGSSLISDNNLLYLSGIGNYGRHSISIDTPVNYLTWSDFLEWGTQLNDGHDIQSVNANPLFTNPGSNDLALQYNSPAIDSGTSVGLTSDYAGNPIYGTPDIGAYEYQPPHTIGTDKIDIGAGARIYGDGKFRDKETINSNLADLSVTPESGNFNSYAADEVRPEWLNITDITWEDNTKEWKESSDNSSLTNTLHTIGDLTPNNYYNVSVDDTLGQNITGTNCTAGICKANSEGKIAFTYTGTYSEHTFQVEAGDNANPTLTNNTSNKFSTDTTSVTLSLTTDENSTCKYSSDQNSTFDNGTVFTTTGETSHTSQLTDLTSGNYTYYAICRDINSNESTYTLTFETSPIIKTSEGKEKMKNSTIYSDKKEIKLQGEDERLKDGTIKIYKNSKLIKTIQADSNGKWNGKVKLSSDFSGYLKVKQYDQYGTLLNEKKTKVKIDNEKPGITNFPNRLTSFTRGNTISWQATDNQKIDKYKIYLGGKIYKTKINSFTIPAKAETGMQYLRIRAYDKAGNSSYKETFVLIK
ncbi:MAG: hypothetical protein UR66_C0003G0032 [Candidatus Moranbacteria bacterium GW2011_GWE1_35_17]|nr:MAG: hypothetical protein UR66_C0003G0032 [Candidatus Moranbacteria bacterium GW2011_GWE1_35_17]